MKELDIIFSSLSRRLGIAEHRSASMILDVAKLEVLGLLMRLQASSKASDSIVKVKRGGNGNAN